MQVNRINAIVKSRDNQYFRSPAVLITVPQSRIILWARPW